MARHLQQSPRDVDHDASTGGDKIMPMPQTGPLDGLGKKFVRVTGSRDAALVEFDFAIGDPALYVELLLPKPAFEQFCVDQQVTFLEAAPLDPATSDWHWGLRQAQTQRFR
jgi:phenol hydroxylase P0 protein